MSNLFIVIIVLCICILVIIYIIGRHFHRKKHINLRLEKHDQYLQGIKLKEGKTDLPNIIIIFCDDMGYADISCFGATTIQTPNIDSLARDGMELTHSYSSSPVCSPSRAGLMTGRYPTRMHVNCVYFPKNTLIDIALKAIHFYTYGVRGILADEVTIPEVLQKVGYKTAMVGKWHLGDCKPHRPTDKGFDFFYGSYYSNDMKPYAMYKNEEIDIPAPMNQDILTKQLTKEAIGFIEENYDKPFFLHYCQPFPHDPLHASDDFKGTSKAGIYGDAVQEVDWSIGEILKTLDKHDLRKNTLVLFTSDNGPWHEGNPGYHRGRKGLTFEGGQRVPMIAYWPGIIPAGKKIDAPTMNIDIFPTVLDILGIDLPGDRIIDGKSMLPVLKGLTNESPHEILHYFWGKKLLAARMGNWKYHVKHASDNSSYFFVRVGPFLFNLAEDQNESYNQIPHHPEQAKIMAEKIQEMKDSLKKNIRGWKEAR
ncbi:MAG: sulfatase [Candidatus Hodarchaeota archaeon]